MDVIVDGEMVEVCSRGPSTVVSYASCLLYPVFSCGDTYVLCVVVEVGLVRLLDSTNSVDGVSRSLDVDCNATFMV